ncbi:MULTISPECIES: hypothetical protein [Spiroplasma]|nr:MULTISPECIES: hypothetical protein [Spiroplasma]MBH8623037.1 hypothetical protein [Spiroplasma sp. hyd1]UNF62516.1 hypothetical protein MNU24_03405 [Spiroplasma poulsonii]
MKLENLQDYDKPTVENNEQNNENIVKRHYEYWIKFKDKLFGYLYEIIKLGKITSFYCNNCNQEKDIDDLNIYDLFFGFSFDKVNVKKETIDQFNVDLCNECNEMNDVTNSYIKVLRNNVACVYCKKLLYPDDEHLVLDNNNYCSRECLRKYLNKTIK